MLCSRLRCRSHWRAAPSLLLAPRGGHFAGRADRLRQRRCPGKRRVVRGWNERLSGLRLRGAPSNEGRARYPRHDHPDRRGGRDSGSRRRLDRRRRPGTGSARRDVVAPGGCRFDAPDTRDGLRRDHSRRPESRLRPTRPERRTSARVTGSPCSRCRGKPNWWRVWLDGKPATEPVLLQNSSNRWRPIATAESWNGGQAVCNTFAFRFDGVGVASANGGSWTPFAPGFRFQDRGYTVKRLSASPGALRTLSGGAPAPYAFEASSL